MPASFRVIILPRAFKDLHDIMDYVAQNSPQNAAKMIDDIQTTAGSLSILPFRYPIYERRRDPAMAVRAMPFPPYMIYYRIDQRAQAVRVLRVIHGSRRQPRRFS
jgi:plasmid stabilization system protein ParE